VIKKIGAVSLFIFLIFSEIFSQNPYFIERKPHKGEGIYAFLRRYMLNDNSCNLSKFLSLNNIDRNTALLYDKKYKLPIYIYDYNGKSIRSTIDDYDYQKALRIKDYNEKLLHNNLRRTHYTKSNILWVPYSELHCEDNISDVEEFSPENSSNEKKTIALFGKEYQDVEIKDQILKNRVYYVVSGHGGPDPGAMYTGGKRVLCEDEYAYDVSLRLARNLIQHGATVYIIIQDKNDGIRDEKYLACDKDERSYHNKELPLNQKERLKQRTDDINELYKKHKKLGVKSQLMISIHVDSRSYHKRLDVFFYHFSGSNSGRRACLAIHRTFEKKYKKFQQGRGYHGTVSARNLYVLENTYPTAVFIELGNIRNTYDQRRFILADNRQALANWIYLGLKDAAGL
jgi:N-acetylmuramoyl-L-alanine amidase